MMTITAQDFTTAELIEALEKRGLQVLNAPLHAEITKAAREAGREACVWLLKERIQALTDAIESAAWNGRLCVGEEAAREALRGAINAIHARGAK